MPQHQAGKPGGADRAAGRDGGGQDDDVQPPALARRAAGDEGQRHLLLPPLLRPAAPPGRGQEVAQGVARHPSRDGRRPAGAGPDRDRGDPRGDHALPLPPTRCSHRTHKHDVNTIHLAIGGSHQLGCRRARSG